MTKGWFITHPAIREWGHGPLQSGKRPDDENPTVRWTDDDVRDWCRAKGFGGILSPYSVMLFGAITATDRDLAIVHFDRAGWPVERLMREHLQCEGEDYD